ncbi:MAG: LamG domain-containing protein [Acidobacteriota bacterium]
MASTHRTGPPTAAFTIACCMACWLIPGTASQADSLAFFANAPNQHDYGLLTAMPPDFGDGEFTFELWIQPDASFPVGNCAGAGQLTHWCAADHPPYSSGGWWFEGNFLLDGHNNASFQDGTMSLQFYGGGRVRWLFGDGANAGPGGHWSIGAFPASDTPSLLTGTWHHLTLVRRFVPISAARLELFIDGVLIASEESSLRTDMTIWWSGWSGFPSGQEGWFFGAEKQAAIGVLSQYEDFKGLVDEMRFWTRAKTAAEVAGTWSSAVDGTEPGLVGWFPFEEGGGTTACDALAPTRCLSLLQPQPGIWSAEGFPVGLLFADGFESGELGS